MTRAAGLAVALVLAGCRPAELVVRVDTDLVRGSEIDAVQLTLQRDTGEAGAPMTFAVPAGTGLLLALGVTPFDDVDVPLNVTARAMLQGNVVVAQSASAHFDRQAVHPIELLLLHACVGIDGLCATTGATCAWGQCVAPAAIPFLHTAGDAPSDAPPALPALTACAPGFASCTTTAGCESDLRLSAHCGACGHACTSGVGCNAPLCDDERATVIAAGGVTVQGMMAPTSAHACAIVGTAATGSKVMCWGSNESGELGVATTPNPRGPVFVDLPWPPQSITAGGLHSCALVEMNPTIHKVYCWGDNHQGQLGLGATTTVTSSSEPLQVNSTILNASMIAAGSSFTCALGEGPTPTVFCWGANGRGQSGVMGISPPTTVDVPTAIAHVTATPGTLCAGLDFGCVATSDDASTVHCWGNYTHTPMFAVSAMMPDFPLSKPATRLACGNDFACALTVDAHMRRHVECFGLTTNGQTGNAPVGTQTLQPPMTVTAVDAIDPDTLVAAGEHACASNSMTGATLCWGDPSFGQLGEPDDGSGMAVVPVAPTNLLDLGLLAAGPGFTCGVRASTKQIMCWGDDSTLELGPAFTSTTSSLPVFVAPPLGSP